MDKCRFCGKDRGSHWVLCSDCNKSKIEGAIDKCRCGNYKKTEHERCGECYEKFKNGKINDKTIKGRLAEAIIEELFLAMGYDVFRFGMENTVPGFGNRKFPKQGEVASQIRNMPDFIVIKNDKISLIEVKYRHDAEFDYKEEYGENYPYPNAYILLVSPARMLIQKASELAKGKEFMYLNTCPDFETDRVIILEFIEFCKRFFGKQ